MALAVGNRVFWGGGRVIGVVVKRYGMQLSFFFFLSFYFSFFHAVTSLWETCE